jgi:hypothetical protein
VVLLGGLAMISAATSGPGSAFASTVVGSLAGSNAGTSVATLDAAGAHVNSLLANAAGGQGGGATTAAAARAAGPQKPTFQSVSTILKAAAPPAQTPFLKVLSYRDSLAKNGPKSGDTVKQYHWLLNYDNSGDPTSGKDDPRCHPSTNPSFPDGGPSGATVLSDPGACPWPSIHYETASPVISEGDQTDWNASKALPAANCPAIAQPCDPANTLDGIRGLKPGKYLISVTSDGYELGGAHFEVKRDPVTGQLALGPGEVIVGLNPFPLPLGTIKARAYSDSMPTSGAYQVTDPPLAGFHATITDFDGLVSVDYYGHPLCTKYKTDSSGATIVDPKGNPTPIEGTGGECVTGADGIVTIPNLPPGRYGVNMIAPQSQQGGKFAATSCPTGATSGCSWVEDTTLEGNHDFDVWVQPNDQGLDTEMIIAGEPVPYVDFGFVPQINTLTSNATGEVKGQLMGATNYVPGQNGIPGNGGNSGFSGIKLDRPLKCNTPPATAACGGEVALSNLNLGGDGQLVYSAPTDANGNFDIHNVPDGDYTLTVWDKAQDYALDQFNVTVAGGKLVDTGVLPLLMWFTRIQGHVFVDLNGNGRQDPGEPGVPNFLMQNLNRTNNQYEQGANTAKTNKDGYYEFTEAYPLGQFTVLQYFNTRYKTTGITYQACNDPQEHQIISPFVDVSFLPIIGQCGRIDVGVQPYDAAKGDNGFIVATALYDSIRVTYPARQTIQFDHLTGIPQITMDLYYPVKCPVPQGTAKCSAGTPNQSYQLAADGSYLVTNGTGAPTSADRIDPKNATVMLPADATRPTPLQQYNTENNGPPSNCKPQDANGNSIPNPPAGGTASQGQQDAVKTPDGSYNARCTESSITGVGVGGGTDNAPAYPGATELHGIQTVDGNYTLGNTDTVACPAGTAPPPTGGTSGCYQNQLGDFIVHAEMPADHVLKGTGGNYNRPLYRMTNEQDVNIASGEQWVPQGANTSTVTWPPTPDPSRQQALGAYQENPGTTSPGPDAQCAGPQFKVHATNGDFLAIGGSPFEGQNRNLCDSKLIHVQSGQSVAPNFHFVTTNDVPIPGKFSGYIVDDVSASTDRKSTNLGEVSGIAGAPIGVYDWAGQLQYTTTSDYNGQFEVLMPSTQSSNCLTPAGVCPNVYRFVGNDPGQFPNPNPNYKPTYRTIAANFQSWPGQFLAADVAPSKAITNLEAPGTQFNYPPECLPAATQPQIFAVDKPYSFGSLLVPNPSGTIQTLDIRGAGFGAAKGTVNISGHADLGLAAITSWSDTDIKVKIPGDVAPGTHQLDVTTAAHLRTVQGLTYHVIGVWVFPHVVMYLPTIAVVGPKSDPHVIAAHSAGSGVAAVFDDTSVGRDATIQSALEWAAGFSTTTPLTGTPDPKRSPVAQALIVVYPALPATQGGPIPFTPAFGTYYENLIIHSPVKIQGVGPGGIDPVTSAPVQGTRIDGAYFWSSNTLPDANDEPAAGEGTDTLPELNPTTNEPYAAQWLTLAEGINSVGGEAAGWSGNTNIIEGQVVYVVAKKGQYTAGYPAAMDGFHVAGGDQKDFPGNINEAFGSKTGPVQEGGNTDELPGVLQTQGGGFFLNAYADHFHITNDLIQGNSGSYGGAIRIGTPYVNSGAVDDGAGQTNTDVTIANNQIIGNGGTNLAGAIGLFSGSNAYKISQNVICGNYSLEYGGGISHFGLSGSAAHPGVIDHNKVILNGANDEGGGITIAGELPLPSGNAGAGGGAFGGGLSPGAGPVVIDSNYIGSNIADDDGGGIRFLMAGVAQQNVTNNMITNNVSSHEGGGISIDDSPNINIVNDTIARNITTATASTSNGAPEPAGISTALNSQDLQRTLTGALAAHAFSDPTIVNSIVWGNLAGSWASGGVVGIGLPGDLTPINVWDMGTVDSSGVLQPTHTLVDQPGPNGGYSTDATDVVDSGADQACPTNATTNNFPKFVAPFCTQIDLVSIRTYFRFRPSAIMAISLPAGDGLGDYHLQATGSPAADQIAKPPTGLTPLVDIDRAPRPTNAGDPGIEMGAGEIHA